MRGARPHRLPARRCPTACGVSSAGAVAMSSVEEAALLVPAGALVLLDGGASAGAAASSVVAVQPAIADFVTPVPKRQRQSALAPGSGSRGVHALLPERPRDHLPAVPVGRRRRLRRWRQCCGVAHGGGRGAVAVGGGVGDADGRRGEAFARSSSASTGTEVCRQVSASASLCRCPLEWTPRRQTC